MQDYLTKVIDLVSASNAAMPCCSKILVRRELDKAEAEVGLQLGSPQ